MYILKRLLSFSNHYVDCLPENPAQYPITLMVFLRWPVWLDQNIQPQQTMKAQFSGMAKPVPLKRLS